MTARDIHRVLLTADCVGGVWPYTMELASSLARRRIEVHLAVMGPTPSPRQFAEATGHGLALDHADVPLDWMATQAAEMLPVEEWLRDLDSRLRPDVVHLNGAMLATAGLDAAIVATQHSCKVTWWRAMRPGQSLPEDWRWYAEANARGLAAADAVVAPSRAFANAITAAYALDRRIDVIHNGRSTPTTRDDGRRASILAAGRFWDEAKDGPVIDTAAARTPWPVEVAGPVEGPDGQRAGFRHARALGPLDGADLRRRMAEAPIFVSASRYEPFGLAPLEAAQAGAALVLADIPTFRELWDGAAVFFEPGDADALAAALKRITSDAALRQRLADAARSRAGRHTPDTMAEATLAVYRRVVHDALGQQGV